MVDTTEFLHIKELVSDTLLTKIAAASKRSTPLRVGGAKTSYLAALLTRLSKQHARRLVCICTNYTQARVLADDLHSFGAVAYCLPWHQSRPYHAVKPSSPGFSERIHALFSYVHEASILCVPADAALHGLPSPQELEHLGSYLRIGDTCSPTELAVRLARWGYTRVSQVMLKGEFSVRGEILDIFPPYRDAPIRLNFDFDSIGTISDLDIETQLSTGTCNAAILTSCSEISWTAQKLSVLQKKSYAQEYSIQEVPLYIEGTEFYTSLIYPGTRIDDYINDSDLLIHIDPELTKQRALHHRDDFKSAYFELDTKFPAPDVLLHTFDSLRKPNIALYPTDLETDIQLAIQSAPRFSGNIQLAREAIATLREQDYSVHILTHSKTQQARFQHLFGDVLIYDRTLHSGFVLPEEKLAVFSEEEILGHSIPAHASYTSTPIASFTDIQENSYVVHINHGIGLFRGIKRMQVAALEQDYLVIEYAQEDSIFVPIDQINLVQRYIGEEHPKKDTIGGTSWKQKKKRIQKDLERIAERLIDLYAERELQEGYAFEPDDEWQEMFESTFAFDETPDQIQALDEIKKDMESKHPMDRLLCGDVGFGKTELAMRIAFKAVMNAKQVALLAPTTVLVEQHYEVFHARMQNFPVRIAMLSRLVSTGNAQKALAKLAAGEIDIIIGTHKLLQRSVRFKDLGLIVIDEEQRFGVKHKEILKEWKKNVDSLMMTATPIPRTLHMSLLDLRKISMLRTPPKNRKPIRTLVSKFTPELVQSALETELNRNGQVFFLHNRIESLDQVRHLIESIVPRASVVCVHGQMSAKELEKNMHAFIHERYNVMVSTTIIENGIDIPNVNTIIIDRADMYGVSQLYQLRGRVGRSDKNAYAYLLYQEKNYLSDIALRRLEVIRDHSELGAGFQIALHDMEMRGVGNLVGREQSGNVHQLGLELYLTLLNQAIQRKRASSKTAQHRETHIEIKHDAYIPSDYIENITEKINVYQEIQAIQNLTGLTESYERTQDKYGGIPPEVELLYSIAKLRVFCYACGIKELREIRKYVNIWPYEHNSIHMDSLIEKAAEKHVYLCPDGSFQYAVQTEDTQKKCDHLIALITSIMIQPPKEAQI